MSSSFSNSVDLIDVSSIVISSSSKRVTTFDNNREAPAESSEQNVEELNNQNAD